MPSRNASINRILYRGLLKSGMDFGTMINLSVQPMLLMRNVGFRNRQRLNVA